MGISIQRDGRRQRNRQMRKRPRKTRLQMHLRTWWVPNRFGYQIAHEARVQHFLVADTQLYTRRCPSVGPLVRRSDGPSVRQHESKSGKTSVSEPFCELFVYVFVLGGGWVGR